MANKQEKREYPRYVPMPKGTDVSYGDPYEVFGIDILFGQYEIDARIYMVKPESVMGILQVGDDQMALTADTEYRALRFFQYDEHGLATGKTLYLLYPDIYPYSTLHVDAAPIEEILPNWPEGVEFPTGSLMDVITKKEAQTLAVNIADLWRQRGGDQTYKLPKTGGLMFKKP